MNEIDTISDMVNIMDKNFKEICGKECWKCRYHDKDNCSYLSKAEALYKAGYRKESEVVKEFAEKVEQTLIDFCNEEEDFDGKIDKAFIYVDYIGVKSKDGAVISYGILDKLVSDYVNKKEKN